MFHFIYKTYSPSGFYYYGRHSTLDINDGYLGSGNWIKSIKDKSKLKRDIVLLCETHKELLEREKEYIGNHIKDPKCMNFNENSMGFSSSNNPNKLLKGSKILSERIKGEKNGMYGKTHTEEYKKYLSENMKGNKNPFYGKSHTEETKNKISKSNKGKKHSPETIEKLKNRFPGTTHPLSKLNETQILEIYNLSWEGKLTQNQIAKKFNIRQGHVTKIKNGKLWQKITNHNNKS
jgi:hypothetical protein